MANKRFRDNRTFTFKKRQARLMSSVAILEDVTSGYSGNTEVITGSTATGSTAIGVTPSLPIHFEGNSGDTLMVLEATISGVTEAKKYTFVSDKGNIIYVNKLTIDGDTYYKYISDMLDVELYVKAGTGEVIIGDNSILDFTITDIVKK